MFENLVYPLMIILLLMNGFFVAMTFLPASQDGTKTLGDIWGTKIVYDMNGTMNIFGNQYSAVTTPIQDTNTEATTVNSDKIDPVTKFLFGAANVVGTGIGAAYTLMGLFQQVLFGYWFWIDLLLSPAWGGLVATLNFMLKIIFSTISLVGLVNFAKGFFIFRNLF